MRKKLIKFIDNPDLGKLYQHIYLTRDNAWMEIKFKSDINVDRDKVDGMALIEADDEVSKRNFNQLVKELQEAIKVYGIRNNALTETYTPTQKEEVWWVSVAYGTHIKQISIQHNGDTKPLNVENYNYYKDKGTAWRLAELIKFMFVSYGMPVNKISIK